MTGITRVSKESIFSDLNNLAVVTTTSNQYTDSFGFTESEIFEALKEYGLADKMNDVKAWYDGFTFGNQRDIYNPWSILNFLKTGKFNAYWANSLVGKLIREGSKNIKTTMESLLEGNPFSARIDEQIVFSQLETENGHSTDEDAVWSLLLASGYLKVVEHWLDEDLGEEQYLLSLTNKEVRIMFQKLIRNWFAGSAAALEAKGIPAERIRKYGFAFQGKTVLIG